MPELKQNYDEEVLGQLSTLWRHMKLEIRKKGRGNLVYHLIAIQAILLFLSHRETMLVARQNAVFLKPPL
jgi:hypothetical protein